MDYIITSLTLTLGLHAGADGEWRGESTRMTNHSGARQGIVVISNPAVVTTLNPKHLSVYL